VEDWKQRRKRRFALLLKRLRGANPAQEFAEQVFQVGSGTYSKWENAQSFPSQSWERVIPHLAELTKISVQKLDIFVNSQREASDEEIEREIDELLSPPRLSLAIVLDWIANASIPETSEILEVIAQRLRSQVQDSEPSVNPAVPSIGQTPKRLADIVQRLDLPKLASCLDIPLSRIEAIANGERPTDSELRSIESELLNLGVSDEVLNKIKLALPPDPDSEVKYSHDRDRE